MPKKRHWEVSAAAEIAGIIVATRKKVNANENWFVLLATNFAKQILSRPRGESLQPGGNLVWPTSPLRNENSGGSGDPNIQN